MKLELWKKSRNNLNLYKANQLKSTFTEIVNSKKSNIIVGCLYKNPVMDVTDFNKYLNPLLDKLSKGKQAGFCSWRFKYEFIKLQWSSTH